jgi:hypothetical protein
LATRPFNRRPAVKAYKTTPGPRKDPAFHNELAVDFWAYADGFFRLRVNAPVMCLAVLS